MFSISLFVMVISVFSLFLLPTSLIFIPIIVLVILMMPFIMSVIVYKLESGKWTSLGKFENQDSFEINMKKVRKHNEKLYNRQEIYITFDDSSNINCFGGIPEDAITSVSLVSDFNEDELREASKEENLELNEFIKDNKIQKIYDVIVLDKNNKEVKNYVEKFKGYDGGDGIIISPVGGLKNVESIKFKSTTPIDCKIFYHSYGY